MSSGRRMARLISEAARSAGFARNWSPALAAPVKSKEIPSSLISIVPGDACVTVIVSAPLTTVPSSFTGTISYSSGLAVLVIRKFSEGKDLLSPSKIRTVISPVPVLSAYCNACDSVCDKSNILRPSWLSKSMPFWF